MNPVDSMPDADLSCRSGQDDAGGPDEAADHASGTQSRSGWTQRPLLEIQDLIDKLAAVTQQLRHPGSSLRSEPGADRPSRSGAVR